METDKIITIVLLILITIILILIFSNTNASPLIFILGACLCLIVQAVLIIVFCFYKLQQTYRQAQTIKLKRNFKLDPEEQFPYQKFEPINQLYFNKYTDQSKFFSKKNQIKSKEQPAEMDDFYFQQFQINEPKRDTMIFLKQIQDYYNTLNIFTDVLVNFGQDLKFIEKGSIFSIKKFSFAQFQNMYPPEIPISQLTQKQTTIFKQTNTKLLREKGEEKLLFPCWSVVIEVLRYIGNEFQKIQAMRKSNSQMLTMIHHKVLQDFSLLQKKLIKIGKQLNSSLKNLKDLQKQYVKYQDAQFNIEDSNQPHTQMMNWFKKQYYTFRDLQRKIKENQLNFKEKKAQKKYYQQKISQFRSVTQKAFMKTVKTRYIALLDSYHITVNDSIQKIQQSFFNSSYVPSKKPKVKNIVISKNLNQALQAEKQYQIQYFLRVKYFQQILDGLINSMDSIAEFLNSLRSVFGEMIKNLKSSQQNKQKIARYFTSLTKKVLQRSLLIYNELNQLVEVNQKMKLMNIHPLLAIKKDISQNVQKSYKILNQIDINQGPIQYKYNSARCQIEAIYQQIQNKISKIQQFQSIYVLHSGRIKKIIITQFIDFLNFQRSLIAIGNIGNVHYNRENRQQVSEDIYGFILGIIQQNNQPENQKQQFGRQFDIEGQSLRKSSLSSTYIKLLNQFLFVGYSQWKNSNFFKQTLEQQLFIAFNKDPNQSFEKIQVSQLSFSGIPPQIVWLKQLKSQQHQMFFDAHIAFRGKIKFKVNTIYKLRLIRDINVEVVIQIQQFYCVMRFCFVPSYIGKGWFSFIGEPISKFTIVPSIGNYRIDLDTLKNIFNNFLLNKLKKHTYPIKNQFNIPASKMDEDLQHILRRFKQNEEKKGYK